MVQTLLVINSSRIPKGNFDHRVLEPFGTYHVRGTLSHTPYTINIRLRREPQLCDGLQNQMMFGHNSNSGGHYATGKPKRARR